MADLIERKPLYELAARLEAEALDYASKLTERGSNGEATSEEWRIWSAVLAERTAFKHDVFDAPSVESHTIYCKDCKWYGRADKSRFYRGTDCLNHRIATIVPDKDYCSRAERRTDEQSDRQTGGD